MSLQLTHRISPNVPPSILSRRHFLAACSAATAGAASMDTILEPRATTALAANRTMEYWGYNGLLPGPTLHLNPGDTARIRLINTLPEPTNLHFHGLHVSPSGHGDNPFLAIPPGEQFDYELTIPTDHPAGTFWYHPHIHERTAPQVYRGLSGAILIHGGLDDIPEIAAVPSETAILQDFTVDRNGRIPEPSMPERMRGREGAITAINGQLQPSFQIERGGALRLRLINASCSRHYRFAVEEHPIAVLALDGNTLPAPLWADDWLLAPGQRADLWIEAKRQPGSYRILNLPYDRGGMGMFATVPSQPSILGHLQYTGSAAQTPHLPESLTSIAPLPAPSITRSFLLSEGMMGAFLINGRAFDHARTDTTVALGATEDWVIENRGSMDHPFHLHVHRFQPVTPSGEATPTWLDTILVPRNSTRRIRIPFLDFPGRTVYHCHILDHEDMGMMGTLDVTSP
ncbi:MAG: multicopper oxidase family protein [Acidobacteria bacterium]|nr:multicopper oxidase family protein [Acidobacteriota bacterium]